ncbi:DNA cytosine methyltransferase [Salinisphaera sp. USBA-960]|nr:DNA cytosine methyltransferase [Salifodinibacter halophilus]NNC25904.1 DNA cytosine methyltransferase [Salifodinibacter halophilus]
MRRPTAIDLFAGTGGLSAGLISAGYDVVFANEVEEAFAQTLKGNHPSTEISVQDVREIDPARIRRGLALEKGELDFLAGGPPCQGFSINAPIRSVEDERNHLFLEYLKFVKEFRPKVAVIENVPGMVSFEKGKTIRDIFLALEELGYTVGVRIVFMPHYGIPQMRWRTVFIATTQPIQPESLFPVPTHFASGRPNFGTKFAGNQLTLDLDYVRQVANYSNHTTIDEAIGDLPPIDNGGGELIQPYTQQPTSEYQTQMRRDSNELTNHICAGLGPSNTARLEHIPPGGSWRDIPFDLLPKGMKRARRSDHTKRYGRLHPDGIASTILTKCDPHWGSYIHPDQDRVLSVREAARLQAFPDHYRFYGSLAEQYKQVGNAVPPMFAEQLGARVLAQLSGHAEELPTIGEGVQQNLALV